MKIVTSLEYGTKVRGITMNGLVAEEEENNGNSE